MPAETRICPRCDVPMDMCTCPQYDADEASWYEPKPKAPKPNPHPEWTKEQWMLHLASHGDWDYRLREYRQHERLWGLDEEQRA